jgi:hypothetical protein
MSTRANFMFYCRVKISFAFRFRLWDRYRFGIRFRFMVRFWPRSWAWDRA